MLFQDLIELVFQMQLLFFQHFHFVQITGNRIFDHIGDFFVQLVVLVKQAGKAFVGLFELADEVAIFWEHYFLAFEWVRVEQTFYLGSTLS